MYTLFYLLGGYSNVCIDIKYCTLFLLSVLYIYKYIYIYIYVFVPGVNNWASDTFSFLLIL